MKVGIVEVAQTEFRKTSQWRAHEFTYHAVEGVLKKTGLPFREGYDAIVTCSSDHWDGKTLSDIEHGEVAGTHLGPGEEKVAMDGANAVIHGYLKILSGHDDVVLVTAACCESQVLGPSKIENFAFDVPYQQLIGFDFTMAAAMQANGYMNKYGLTREDFAHVVIKNLRNAKDNPFTSSSGDFSVEDVLNSEMLSHPITKIEAKPTCNGACALLLASEEKAKELTDKPVWIKGIGSCYDAHYLGDRKLYESVSLRKAAGQSYKMAGINDPHREIDLFEISEHYSYQEPLWMEGLGLCKKGNGGEMIRSGETERDGEIPVNSSGGLLSGVPRYVAGANRVIEAFLQLRKEADYCRGSDGEPKTALAHGTDGPCGQHHCVIILEKGF